MRTSSIPGIDLREAVDGLRDAFEARFTDRSRTPAHRDIRSAILVELSAQPMHGYQLIQAIETRSGGSWKPTPGAVYPTLQLLADEGLVTGELVGERTVYTITEAGRAAIVVDVHDSSEQSRRPSTVTLTKSSVKLAQALTQFPNVATAEQSERAAAIIDDARRKLYAILAED